MLLAERDSFTKRVGNGIGRRCDSMAHEQIKSAAANDFQSLMK